MKTLREEAMAALTELCEKAAFQPHDLVVIGGSSSEVDGGVIGKQSSLEIGREIISGLREVAKTYQIDLAIQCCEHLNRALVVEAETAKRYQLERVTVVPALHAGGSFSTNAMDQFDEPVVVESVRAHGGLDIGITMIAMHLRRVVVPVRLENDKVGKAMVIAARTRYPLIGGERAQYK